MAEILHFTISDTSIIKFGFHWIIHYLFSLLLYPRHSTLLHLGHHPSIQSLYCPFPPWDVAVYGEAHCKSLDWESEGWGGNYKWRECGWEACLSGGCRGRRDGMEERDRRLVNVHLKRKGEVEEEGNGMFISVLCWGREKGRVPWGGRTPLITRVVSGLAHGRVSRAGVSSP